MDIEYLGKVGYIHFRKRLVAENAGIGTQEIDAAPLLRSPLDHRRDLSELRDVGAVGHRRAAGLADFLDHGFRGRERTAGAVPRAAEIVDHELWAAACEPQRIRPSKTLARAGHH